MTHFAFTHEFATDADRYWNVFFDEAYNRELCRRLDISSRTVLRREEDGATIRYEQLVVPRRELPLLVRPILRGDLGYVEKATFYKGMSYMDVTIESTLLKDRADVTAKYSVVPTAPGRVLRTYEGDVHVDLPIVARAIEAAMLQDVRRSFDVAAAVTQAWLAAVP
jgi:hypothetical protein